MTKNFEAAMANVARGYASTVTRLAKGFAPNNHLKDSIASTVEIGEGKFIIRIRARGPDARAREYGSGVWARRGPKGKILIKPRSARALVFPWEVATSPISGQISPNVPRLEDGRVILKQVEHPGVDAANEGKGYLHPAINETNKLIRKRVLELGKQGIVLDLRASFRTQNA